MDYIFITGVIGSLFVVTGAAWPKAKDTKQPTKSLKNWLFAIGAIIAAEFLYNKKGLFSMKDVVKF